MKYSYEEIIDIIQNARRFGTHTGMEVSGKMLETLGQPQKGIPFVHIAGTNGKGSTTAFLCKILEKSGKRVGMFTSPHLVRFEERIRVNGQMISKEEVTRLGNLLLATNFELSPTMFDYCLCMAVLYFKEQACDIMVMETGIGGRYDSTNALGTSEVAVITKIGMDHMAVLGNTLEAIAGEKAGIMKPGAPVVVSPQTPEVLAVLKENYRFLNVVQKKQEIDKTLEKSGILEHDGFFLVDNFLVEKMKDFSIKMLGAYQLENAATAVLAAELLFRKWGREAAGTTTDIGNQEVKEVQHIEQQQNAVQTYIREGIEETFWKGRMELICEEPFFLIDGAHNAHGVHALAESLKVLYPKEKFHFIMAVMADKDYEDMIQEILPLAIDFITVSLEYSRALQAKELAECIKKYGVEASYCEDLKELLRQTLGRESRKLNTEGLEEVSEKTIAFGSLYFIGEIEAYLEAQKPK